MENASAYGLWSLVVVNSLVFIIFAFSFTRPRTNRDWRSFGAFSGFIIALFTEMYGLPLTIYLLSGWLGGHFPGLDLLSHEAGHLWHTWLGLKGSPHFHPLHLLSNIFVFCGFILLAAAWDVLYKAQRAHEVATTGPYAVIRHPQYAAFIIIMLGFLLQWPTIPTLLMFPILVGMYIHLARKEEREAFQEFGDAYVRYTATTPRFIPGMRRKSRKLVKGNG